MIEGVEYNTTTQGILYIYESLTWTYSVVVEKIPIIQTHVRKLSHEMGFLHLKSEIWHHH